MPVPIGPRLPESWSKEALSRAYVASLAAAAGVSFVIPPDLNSIDVLLTEQDDGFGPPGQLSLQLKCTSGPLKESPDEPGMWRFKLKAKNYADLCRTPTFPRRLLVVVACPVNMDDWVIHAFPHALVMQTQAWWVCLEGLPPLPEGQKHKTISIPQNQRFDTSAVVANIRSTKWTPAP
ncbi:DUF4365 domain-containing protein [Patulibacter defluvii]|uniref:DUF4365 domain-containing protein n=1 Tax=Patulibacter defluvii TaxID=3095358 RepID=UPI002A74A325|nr:DUF4365 domain-containing protein [Patulibacter sp. DM4]